jgi:hypothetical protein
MVFDFEIPRSGYSTLKYPARISRSLLKMAEAVGEVQEEVDEEIRRLLSNKDANNTKKITKLAFNVFSCVVDVTEAEKDPVNLDKNLAKFYATAKKEDGQKYKAETLLTFRQGLRMHYQKQMNVDIVNDRQFSYSTKVFKATVADLRRKGLGVVKHHIPITKDDMTKLYSGDTCVFDVEAPYGLLNKVWFEIMYYLCRRGQENLRAMNKNTFDISADSAGRRFVYQKVDELDKNHRDLSTGNVTQGRMYELPGNNNYEA